MLVYKYILPGLELGLGYGLGLGLGPPLPLPHNAIHNMLFWRHLKESRGGRHKPFPLESQMPLALARSPFCAQQQELCSSAPYRQSTVVKTEQVELLEARKGLAFSNKQLQPSIA
jgi:hypothetical protein